MIKIISGTFGTISPDTEIPVIVSEVYVIILVIPISSVSVPQKYKPIDIPNAPKMITILLSIV